MYSNVFFHLRDLYCVVTFYFNYGYKVLHAKYFGLTPPKMILLSLLLYTHWIPGAALL